MAPAATVGRVEVPLPHVGGGTCGPATPPGARVVTAAALAAAVAVSSLVLHTVGGHAAGIVFAVGVAVGLPHGSVDHVALAWAAGRRPGWREALLAACGYALAAGLACGALVVDRPVALAVALAVSAYHFGTVDAGGLRRHPLAVAAYGLVPVLGPLARWPHRADAVLTHLSPGVAHAWSGWLPAVCAGAVACAVAAAAVDAASRRRWAVVTELTLLVVVVVVLPPLAAFGCYFATWHAPRHLARLAGLRPFGGVATLAQQAALPTVVAAAALAAAWLVVPGVDRPAIGVGLLLAVAVPHTVVVGRLPWPPGGRRGT